MDEEGMYTDPSGKSFGSWWKRNISDPFMREFHHVFGNGFTIGVGTDFSLSSWSLVGAPNNSNGLPYGPGIGLQTSNWKSFTPVAANFQNGFVSTQPLGQERRMQQSVLQAEKNAKIDYYTQNSDDYGSVLGYVNISAGAFVVPGYSGEVGYVYTDKNYMQYYISIGSGFGMGVNASINSGLIIPLSKKNPQLDNWNGISLNGNISLTDVIGLQGGVSSDDSYAYGGLSLGYGTKWSFKVFGGAGHTILLGHPIYIGSRTNISSNNCFGGYYPY